jgi:hypothetical protein
MMMSVKVVIGKMRVVKIDHMQRCQHPVEPPRFVHDLMGHCELHGEQVRSYEDITDDHGDSAPRDLVAHLDDAALDTDCPGKDHGHVKGHPEIPVISLKFPPLF